MIHDHRAIVARIERLSDADLADTDRVQELLYALHALISVHFEKEEQIQLPAFDEQPREVVEQILQRMGSAGAQDHHGPS
jgi:iron-sulfur cluster repair protein YtfE (RIC family)